MSRRTVLVLCEFSDTVGAAFRRQGFYTLTNDLLPTEGDRPWLHIQGDCIETLKTEFEGRGGRKFDLVVMHPSCTAIAVSGNSTYGRGMPKHKERLKAIEWTMGLWEEAISKANHVAMENPVNVLPLKATQFVQPYEFGHPAQKKTGFWLHNLPKLEATKNVYEQMMQLPKNKRQRIHYLPPSTDRWKIRSTTFPGLAEAMALQWGNYICKEESNNG